MRQEIRAHTGLRGIAALLVVAYHQQFAGSYRLPLETATLLFRRSYLMVDLFFILSGFVLSYVYGSAQFDVRSFFRARFARIYPLHVFALMCLTAFTLAVWTLMHATGREPPELGSFGDWLRQLVLLNAWFPAKTEWNVPSWSISAEAFAYLLFPLLVRWLRRPVIRLFVFSCVVGFYWLVGSSLDIIVGFAPLRCLAGFTLGMLLFHYRARSVPLLTFWQIAAVFWILLVLALPIADPLIIPAFAALVYLTANDRGIVARWLSARPFHWLGQISYSIYLMHVTVGALVWFVWQRLTLPFGPAANRAMFLCLDFAGVLMISHFTYEYIERPCQDALRKPKQAAVAVAAP